MIVSIIAAISQNGIIGNKGKMPWKISEEMKFFKEKTLDHPVIMGRKTWDSLYIKPLPKRFNLVITRNKNLLESGNSDNLAFVPSIEDALNYIDGDTNECFIIGGSDIWKYALDQEYVDRMYLNVLNDPYDGDTSFPYYEQKKWITEPNKTQYEFFKSYTLIKKKEPQI